MSNQLKSFVFILALVCQSTYAQVTVSKGVYKETAFTTDTLQVYNYNHVFHEKLTKYPVGQARLNELLVGAVYRYCEDAMAKRSVEERDTVFLTIAEGRLPSKSKVVQYRALRLGKSKGEIKKDETPYTQIQWHSIEQMEIGAVETIVISWDEILNDVAQAIEDDLEYEFPGAQKFFTTFRKLLENQFIAFDDVNKDPVFYSFNCTSCIEKEVKRLKDEFSEVQTATIIED